MHVGSLGAPAPQPASLEDRVSCLGWALLASLALASCSRAACGPDLMMLAAAFRSCVRSSGSCMTSSRKLITLHLSSSLVSKSYGKKTGQVAQCQHQAQADCLFCHLAQIPWGTVGL